MARQTLLSVSRITKFFDEKNVLDDVSFSLYAGERVGFVGANGAGKSTLMKIIMGEYRADSGAVNLGSKSTLSYLPQELSDTGLVSDYLGLTTATPQQRKTLFEWLNTFKLSESLLEREIKTLSGGEKTKIFLIKIAIQDADVVMLDEPTNNLDTEGIILLESIVSDSKSSFLIVSHDRAFLDNTVTKIIELEEFSHQVAVYDGNYQAYKEKKEQEQERYDILRSQNQKQKRKIEREIKDHQFKITVDSGKSFSADNDKLIDHFKWDRNDQKSEGSLRNAKKKLDVFNEKNKRVIRRPLKIDFSEMKRSGNQVLVIDEITKRYPEVTVGPVDFELLYGDRVHVTGPNGSGKTTLIKIILDRETADSGSFSFGSNVVVGYLPQELSDQESEQLFIDYFLKQTEKEQSDARKILARFSFTAEEVKQKIKDLSPGMRGRGKIALMLANNPNLLILDEPTNNLDIIVLEELERALKTYKGSILFTSHDRYFAERVNPNKFIKLG